MTYSDIVNIFKCFTLLRTTLFISHGSFVSLYNVQESKWIRHFKFEDGRVLCLAKVQSLSQNNSNRIELSVVTESGWIYNSL